MRFRIASNPPVESFKAWFDVPNDGSIGNILDVKSALCSRLPQLVENGTRLTSTKVSLFIDGFELLDDSGLDVIKENDLVHVSKRQSASPPHPRKKRKIADDQESTGFPYGGRRFPNPPRNTLQRLLFPSSGSEGNNSEAIERASLRRNLMKRLLEVTSEVSDGDAHPKRIKREHGTVPIPSESEDTDDDSSSESSSSSSSSSSATTTSSSSCSSSDSSSLPSSPVMKARSSRLAQKTENALGIKCAPPGQGKPATHSRNTRRRIKRMHEKQQKEAEQAATHVLSADSVNSVPLGAKGNNVAGTEVRGVEEEQKLLITPAVEQDSPIEVESMVTSLRNKNKRKGFKNSMASTVPQRIVFTDDSGAPPESGSTLASSAPNASAPVARLVTPSEKQAMGLLPPNMFVTSVEVESENWDKKKKIKQRNIYGNELATDEPMTGNDDMILDYGEAGLDWASVDRDWGKMQIVADPSSLTPGVSVGWKALAINPTTFTPETLVHVAHVKEVKHDSSSIVVEPIHRPGSDSIAFGAFADVTGEQAKSTDISAEEIPITFEEALAAQWRLVNI